ncbi:DJ-1/PfpI family protein [Halalkalibacter sp. APA_J-10(15)]|uniref:DJ-1/PfpI family protein n=1 Tax=Halalkalibacter sp. APA_J-10(15) TaxID=2933805 RepID=UPI001FF66D48|nr:DJ-1/PfpI family protein [Halalkalibacter sp. APA_J-10(15)]MCK0469899.1 DJ-1/PfpI family protein [Halalkalibacter sp. APA_J-10(15)]
MREMRRIPQRTVGILLFNEVEVLDFAGPFEVFSITSILHSNEKPFVVKTISESGELVTARNGLKVKPDYSFANHPALDIVIIPGGYGAEEIEINNPKVIEWIQHQQPKVEFMTSVCTGALLLAKAGILDGRKATTHWMDIDRLEQEFPSVSVQRGVKFVDEGALITSGGISAGINMSFYLISRLHGKEAAIETARRMEYEIELSCS